MKTAFNYLLIIGFFGISLFQLSCVEEGSYTLEDARRDYRRGITSKRERRERREERKQNQVEDQQEPVPAPKQVTPAPKQVTPAPKKVTSPIPVAKSTRVLFAEALSSGSVKTVRRFIDEEVNIDNFSYLGQLPIHLAAQSKNLPVVKLLKEEEKVNLNAKDKQGNAAIHYAVANNDMEMVAYLISKRVNLSAKNGEGKRPVQLAQKAKNYKLSWMIQEAFKNDQ